MNTGPPTEGEIELLRQLARNASRTDPGSEARPSEEAIWAFASGTASAEQRAEVIHALKASALLRGEFLELWNDIEALRSADSKSLPSVIDRKAVARIMGAERPSLWRRIADFMAADRLVAGALGAAAAAAVLLIALGGPETTSVLVPIGLSIGRSPEMVMPVDPSIYQPDVSRGSGETEPTFVPEDGKDAALIAFLDALETRDGQVTVRRDSPSVVRDVVIRFNAGSDSYVETHWDVPLAGTDLEAWVVAILPGSLFRIPVTGDSTIVAWDVARWGDRVPACVTFKLDGANRATPVQELRLR